MEAERRHVPSHTTAAGELDAEEKEVSGRGRYSQRGRKRAAQETPGGGVNISVHYARSPMLTWLPRLPPHPSFALTYRGERITSAACSLSPPPLLTRTHR